MKLSEALTINSEWWAVDHNFHDEYLETFGNNLQAIDYLNTTYGAAYWRAPNDDLIWLCLLEAEYQKDIESKQIGTGYNYG